MGALGAAVVPAYRRDLAAARRRLADPPVPVHRLELPAGTVEYARYGSGTPVLVLHGAGQGWDGGVDWAQRRLGSGDVLAVSRFGYLGSSLPEGATTTDQADTYAALLDALSIERADVVGLSAGSVTAIRFAGRHPDRIRRLVLESPMLPVSKPVRLPPAAAYRALARLELLWWGVPRLPVTAKLAAGAPPKALDDAARSELAALNATTIPLRPRVAGAVFDRAVAVPELYRGELPIARIAAPTLVVNAAEALLAPHQDAVAFVRRLPDARLVELDTGGHLLIGNVDGLRALLADFLV
jgi:2-hydroxy-6-oxonona-2,4-dienedioate hydrolase